MRRGVSLCIVAVVTSSVAFVVSATPAWAACSDDQIYGHISAINQHEPTFGSTMDVWVNNFNTHQLKTWRSITVWQNSQNFAEVGWITWEPAGDQQAHRYKTRMNNGVLSGIQYNGTNIPRDEFHNFSVKDPDDDNQYHSYMDGNPMGDSWFVSIDPALSNSQMQSERLCTADSLWAEYRHLQFMNGSGNWVNFNDKVHNHSFLHEPYMYCNVSATAFDTKQAC